MPKSWSLRASMPMRTAPMISGGGGLVLPAGVIEPVLAQDVAARAGVHIRPARGLVNPDDAVAHGVGLRPGLGERAGTAARHHALHRARVENREPLTVEPARNGPPIARRP